MYIFLLGQFPCVSFSGTYQAPILTLGCFLVLFRPHETQSLLIALGVHKTPLQTETAACCLPLFYICSSMAIIQIVLPQVYNYWQKFTVLLHMLLALTLWWWYRDIKLISTTCSALLMSTFSHCYFYGNVPCSSSTACASLWCFYVCSYLLLEFIFCFQQSFVDSFGRVVLFCFWRLI